MTEDCGGFPGGVGEKDAEVAETSLQHRCHHCSGCANNEELAGFWHR